MPIPANLKRPKHVPLMLSEAEKAELRKAADAAGMALSVFIRVTALEAARRRESKAA
jgi:uncharacterized protein (DUF1778 family)